MNAIPLALIRYGTMIFNPPTEGALPSAQYKLIVSVGSGDFETMYVCNSNTFLTGQSFNPYSFVLDEALPVIPDSLIYDGFWNHDIDSIKGNPRILNGLFPIDAQNAKFIGLVSGDHGTTTSRRSIGVCRISETGEMYGIPDDPLMTAPVGDSYIDGCVVYFESTYNIFIVHLFASGVTTLEHWKTSNLVVAPTLYKTIASSDQFATNDGSIYNGGFTTITSFIYNNEFKLMVGGITVDAYPGLNSVPGSEGYAQMRTIGWWDYVANKGTQPNPGTTISPDFMPSYVGPVIVPFPINSESYPLSTRKMLGPQSNPIIFGEGGKNYIILGFSGYKYNNAVSADNLKVTTWIYELNLL